MRHVHASQAATPGVLQQPADGFSRHTEEVDVDQLVGVSNAQLVCFALM